MPKFSFYVIIYAVIILTEKLYDKDAYLKSFDAKVISCQKAEGFYKVILNKTAFFPEEGGQYSDKGNLNGVEVFNVQLENGEIVHYCKESVCGEVHGEINFDRRFRNMQNHTGEHIISGLVFSLFGGQNVGFHLGEDEVTCDYDIILSDEQLKVIEYEANMAIYKNFAINGCYPEKSELENLNYRSKKEIIGDIRIVTIENIDCCACCAPHVKSTGEVGIIKILSVMKLRGGIRLFISCGLDAFNDYSKKHDEIKNISSLLACKTNECDQMVNKINDSLKKTVREFNFVKSKIYENQISKIEKTDSNLLIFIDEANADTLRSIVNCAKDKCDNLICAFSGNDNDGYSYIIYSSSADVNSLAKDINRVLCGRGGGRNPMIQGSISAKKESIENYFSPFSSLNM